MHCYPKFNGDFRSENENAKYQKIKKSLYMYFPPLLYSKKQSGPASEKSPVFLSSRNCKIQKHHVLANQFGQPPMFLDFRIYQNWADRTFFALCNNLGTLCRKFINPSRKAAPTSLSHTQTNNNGLDRCNGTPLSVLDHRLLMFLPCTCLVAPSPGPPYAQPISE